jgi:putative endonuclease
MSSFSQVLYIGVTNNLIRRVEEHKNGVVEGFTSKYKINRLVYYEHFFDINYAIKREKELKAWRREKKINLVKQSNHLFKDMYSELLG